MSTRSETTPLAGSPEMDMPLELAREGLYRFLSAALRDPRDPGAKLARDGDSLNVATAAADLLRANACEHQVRRGFGELPPSLLSLTALVEVNESSFEEQCSEFDRVFGLVVAAECPPYETEYHSSTEPFFRSQQLADVAGFYRAFGLDTSSASPERTDFLPLELEFMAFVLLKKRLAFAAGDVENAKRCAEVEHCFFRDHLAWWTPSFATGLRRRAESGRYVILAQALAAFMPVERQRLEVDTPSIPVMPKVIERPEEQSGCSVCPSIR